VTVFWRAKHRSISPNHSGQLSLLSSAGREMGTSQRAADSSCPTSWRKNSWQLA